MKNVCAVLVVLLLAASPALATIQNSAHDLSGLGSFVSKDGSSTYGSTNTDRLCVYCHTPHGAASNAPLWNRNNNAMSGAAVYTSSTFDFTMVATNGDTPLCMGCHDGDMTNALINLNGAASGTLAADTGNGKTLAIASNLPADIGGGTLDFTNDHPVGFTYVAASDLQGGLKAIGTAGVGITVPADLLRGAGGDEMWCASCHDVHEPGTGSSAPFLRMSNSQSALCFICHNK